MLKDAFQIQGCGTATQRSIFPQRSPTSGLVAAPGLGWLTDSATAQAWRNTTRTFRCRCAASVHGCPASIRIRARSPRHLPRDLLRRYARPPAARIIVTRSRSGPVRSCSPTKTARSAAWMT